VSDLPALLSGRT